MAKGRPRDPTRARRGTGHRELPGQAKKPARLSAVPDVDPAPKPRRRSTTKSASTDAPPPDTAAVVLALPPSLEPPDDLPEGAHPIWRQAVAELAGTGLRAADLEAVRMMCVAALRAREAGQKVAEFGVLVKGQRGPMVNPMLKVERDATMTYLRLAEQFGLTTASRLRLGLIQLAGQSILASLNADLDADG